MGTITGVYTQNVENMIEQKLKFLIPNSEIPK